MTGADALTRGVEAACRAASGAIGVQRAVAGVLREAVPFDKWCVLTIDPAVALPTGGYHDEGVPPERTHRLSEIEAGGEDVLAIHDLVRRDVRTGILSAATGGRLDSSSRYRDVFAPSGIEHELRLLFTTGGGAWGALIAMRGEGEPDFTPVESRLVERATANVATAIRRELLLAELADDPLAGDGPGLLLLDGSLSRVDVSAAAQRWLAEIDDGVDAARALPYALLTLAGRARDGTQPVTTRLRTASGRWLTLYAERLGEGISVIMVPTRPLELAELIADAYGLTAREREVVRLLAMGHSRAQIARLLVVSAHTVDDHVKRAFAKTGVRSRAELAAKLFFDQNLPRMRAGIPVGGSGWFLR